MFLVNYLNRNITDEFAPLFESLYILEFSVIIATLIISIPIADAVWQTSLHRNIKLRINFGIMEACISVIFRAIVIVHQYVGVTLVEYDEPPLYLVVCSLMREAFLCYFTTVASIIAFDRGVATIGWSWYESQVPSTLLFFACQESVLVGIAWLVSASLIYDYITDITIILYFAFILVIGSTAFIVVYRLNLKEVRILKQGAVVNQYSIARTYQLNENIAHLKMLSRLVGPLVAATTPAFVFYPVYRLIPPSIGYDGLRHFSVEMYDLWLGITGVLVITCVPVFEPKISRKLRLLPKSLGVRVIPTPSDEQSTKVNRLEGDTYFNMLSRDLTRIFSLFSIVMLPVDWALVAYGVCIPLLIALYVFVLCIIMRRRKSYDASFHKIFTALGGVNIGACLVSTFVFRLPHYPLVNYFYSSLMVGWWLSVANSGVHFLITLSEFLGVLLAFNRFTALFFSQWHDQIWRWFFSIGVILCALVSFAPVWHLLTDETRFYEADEAREGYKFYYLDTKANYPKAQTSIWFNMVVVVLTSNIISFLLYVACLVRLRCCSAKKYPSIERNLFIAGFLTLICSLPYTICKTIFYLEISSPVDAKNVELIRFWGFQQPWLLDLMHLTPAPLLILTSNTIRKDIRKMLCSRNTA